MPERTGLRPIVSNAYRSCWSKKTTTSKQQKKNHNLFPLSLSFPLSFLIFFFTPPPPISSLYIFSTTPLCPSPSPSPPFRFFPLLTLTVMPPASTFFFLPFSPDSSSRSTRFSASSHPDVPFSISYLFSVPPPGQCW